MKQLYTYMILFFLTCSFNITLGVGENFGENAAKILAQGGQKMADTIAGGFENHGAEAAQIMAPALEKAFSVFGQEAAEKIVGSCGSYDSPLGSLAIMVAVYTTIYALEKTVQAGNWGCRSIKKRFWPSTEQKLQAHKIKEEYELLLARKKLSKCLVDNANLKRCALRLPCACDDDAKKLAMMRGGDQEFNSIVENFTKHNSPKQD